MTTTQNLQRFVPVARALAADEAGATAVEYGLIVALISIAALAAFTAVGQNVSTVFNTIATAL